ncbi:MAG: AAA family ATPase [Phycisphaerae bacterium]|nr:AAA family ATPase [Phycisphaerae bacterium]
MRKIAILNQKGGVGKTTTVVNVSAALALEGHRVLVIDLDPQAHLTIHLGADQAADAKGVYDVLTGSVAMGEAIHPVRNNLWLLGANIDLVGAESELINEVGREIILKKAVESVEDRFDFLLIDCPPSLGLLTLNALAAVDEVIIPIQPHFLALQGFSRLLQTVTLVHTRINPALRVSAILMCMFDSRTSLSSEVREDIKQFLSGARNSSHPWAQADVIPVHIRPNIKLAEAPSHGQTIFEYEPHCNGAADYEAVAAFLSGEPTEAGTADVSETVETTEMNEVAAVEETEIAATDAANTNETPQDSPQSVSLDREKNETAESISQEQSTPHFGI